MSLILHVVGARPNFVKAAPVIAAVRALGGIRQQLVHTGQHVGESMSDSLFDDLGLPAPDWRLDGGSRAGTDHVARMAEQLSPVFSAARPDLTVVYGDVNSTLAGAQAAAASHVPIAHVEAGLRSFDLSMPEEHNRVAVDRLATILLTPSEDAGENLRREGMTDASIRFVGNVMIDTLLAHRTRAPWPDVAQRFGIRDRSFAVLTLHRPANVDTPDVLANLLDTIASSGLTLPVVFPVHPRTSRQLDPGVVRRRWPFLTTAEPLTYPRFVALADHAACVLTDSGGVQEETTVLGVPCFTLRENTERPITVTHGTNTLVGADARGLAPAVERWRQGGGTTGSVPPLWDGRTADRIAAVLGEWLSGSVVRRTIA